MITNKRLASGTLSNANATLYEVPEDAMAIVKAVTLCNTSAGAVTITLTIAGVAILSGHSLAANAYLHIPQLDQIMEAEDLLEGLAGTDAVIDYYISGKEIA